MRRAARIDQNHLAITGALKACGAKVQSLAAIGGGVADLLVYYPPTKRLKLMEVKDGSKSPSRRALTPAQLEWHKSWPVVVVETMEEAIAALARHD